MGMAMGSPPPRAPYKTKHGYMYCEACMCSYGADTNFVRGFRIKSNDTMGGHDFYATSRVPKGECPSCGIKEEADKFLGEK